MPDAVTEDAALKQLLKETVIETLHEQREMFHEIFSEVMEDFALLGAIREGQSTKPVDRDEVFRLLRNKS
ncbi:MAG: hypothetical protein KF861_06805 [Planctomycetaceae bacterium]|nr:hypothetical protein [Planctomycetaceae bacterium]